jgi:hypothetical protein
MNKKNRAFSQYSLLVGKVKLFFRIFQVSIFIAYTHIPQTTKEQKVTRKQLNQNFTHHVANFLHSIPKLTPFKQLTI